MTTLHTHYDNLKVPRDASPAAIHAAYQLMQRRFGPEQHPGDAQLARKMAIISASYAVLSNPHQRALHDLWVAQNDADANEDTVPPSPPSIPSLWLHSEAPQQDHPTQPPQQQQQQQLQPQRERQPLAPPPRHTLPRVAAHSALSHLQRNWSLYALGAVVACLALVTAVPKSFLADDGNSSAAPGPLRGFPVPVLFAARYTRPATAPNGQPWPASAGHIDGYPQLNTGGALGITLDNSQNDADMFVKLVSLDGTPVQPVRHVYLPAFGRFTVEQLTAGRYDIRYRNLSTGALVRSLPVSVQPAAPAPDGTEPGPPSIALRKEASDNMPGQRLVEREFF